MPVEKVKAFLRANIERWKAERHCVYEEEKWRERARDYEQALFPVRAREQDGVLDAEANEVRDDGGNEAPGRDDAAEGTGRQSIDDLPTLMHAINADRHRRSIAEWETNATESSEGRRISWEDKYKTLKDLPSLDDASVTSYKVLGELFAVDTIHDVDCGSERQEEFLKKLKVLVQREQIGGGEEEESRQSLEAFMIIARGLQEGSWLRRSCSRFEILLLMLLISSPTLTTCSQ